MGPSECRCSENERGTGLGGSVPVPSLLVGLVDSVIEAGQRVLVVRDETRPPWRKSCRQRDDVAEEELLDAGFAYADDLGDEDLIDLERCRSGVAEDPALLAPEAVAVDL